MGKRGDKNFLGGCGPSPAGDRSSGNPGIPTGACLGLRASVKQSPAAGSGGGGEDEGARGPRDQTSSVRPEGRPAEAPKLKGGYAAAASGGPWAWAVPRPRCVRIRSMSSGWLMNAMVRMEPPQRGQSRLVEEDRRTRRDVESGHPHRAPKTMRNGSSGLLNLDARSSATMRLRCGRMSSPFFFIPWTLLCDWETTTATFR